MWTGEKEWVERDAPNRFFKHKGCLGSQLRLHHRVWDRVEEREAEYIQKDRMRHEIPSPNDVFTIRLYASVGLEAQCFVERMLISDAYSSHLSFSVPHFLLLVPAHQSAP